MDGRKRIAAEVYDGIGQSLSARKYSLENEVKKLSQSQGHGETLKGLEVVAGFTSIRELAESLASGIKPYEQYRQRNYR